MFYSWVVAEVGEGEGGQRGGTAFESARFRGRPPVPDPTIYRSQPRRIRDGKWALDAPATCGRGHRLGSGGVLVGWDNRVPTPTLCWTCRRCGHITWADDPNRALPEEKNL